MPRASAGHFVSGVEGLALLRSWLADRAQADRRIAELGRLLADTAQPPFSIEMEVPGAGVEDGYGRWATSYDDTPNALIYAEEPVVRSIIDEIEPGSALDAACGTGRHSAYLHSAGHRVVGIDVSEPMLEHARRKVPGAAFRMGDLAALPLDDAEFDLVVCALALSHAAALDAPVKELARVVRPGGTVVISDFHPTLIAIGGTGFFIASDGSAGNVSTYYHGHGEYLSAFRAAGLEVERCIEPLLDDAAVAMMSGGLIAMAPEAFRAAYLGLPAALVWQLRR